MDSTANILIVVILVGVIVLGAIWALSRKRPSADIPPAKLDDSAVVSEPAIEVASSPPELRQSPEPGTKPDSKAPARSVRKKSEAPKAAPVRAPAVKKEAAKKSAAPATPPEAAPLTAIGVAGAVGPPDSLLQIKGLGPKLNTLLDGLGITRFDQIAAWRAEDVAKVDEHLGAFKGRIERDSWIEQAGFLAKGAIAEFEAKFGKLDSENK